MRLAAFMAMPSTHMEIAAVYTIKQLLFKYKRLRNKLFDFIDEYTERIAG